MSESISIAALRQTANAGSERPSVRAWELLALIEAAEAANSYLESLAAAAKARVAGNENAAHQLAVNARDNLLALKLLPFDFDQSNEPPGTPANGAPNGSSTTREGG